MRLIDQLANGLRRKVLQLSRHGRRLGDRNLFGVSVHGLTHQIDRLLRKTGHQLGSQFGFVGRTKPDRPGHAFALGNAVVGPLWGQVQHVTRLQYEFIFRHKVVQNLERHALLQAQVFLATNAPAALAVGLQQEHVVAVKVWADAAPIGGVADHQIVQTCVGHKTKLLQQIVRTVVVQIHALHQKRPLLLGKRWQAAARQGAVLEAPALGTMHDQARLYILAGRHLHQILATQEGLKTGNSLTDQQRLFVPIDFHETLGRETAQQCQRLLDIHRCAFRGKTNCDNCRMEIKSPCVVALTWTLMDTLGETLDVLDEPVEFLVGGADLLPKIEEALQGHAAGAKLDLHLEPEDAFGDFNDQLIFLEPRSLFPAEVEEGLTIEGTALPQDCNTDAPRNVLYTIAQLYPDHVVLDGNHPLAGIALRLRVQVASVREATVDEVGRGTCGTGFFKIEVGEESSSDGHTLH